MDMIIGIKLLKINPYGLKILHFNKSCNKINLNNYKIKMTKINQMITKKFLSKINQILNIMNNGCCYFKKLRMLMLNKLTLK
jgi:hypothetical protein